MQQVACVQISDGCTGKQLLHGLEMIQLATASSIW